MEKAEYETHSISTLVTHMCFYWVDVPVGLRKEELKLHLYIDVVGVFIELYIVHCF